MPSASSRDGIFVKSYSVTLCNKVCSCEICKALNADPFLPIDAIPATLVQPCVQNTHERSARWVLLATDTGKRPRGWPSNMWQTTSQTLLGPILMWSQQNYLRLVLSMIYF